MKKALADTRCQSTLFYGHLIKQTVKSQELVQL